MALAASTQAGAWPSAILSAQKLHFSTTPFILVGYSGFVGNSWLSSVGAFLGSPQLKLLAPNGQAAIQNLHPMHRWGSIMTTPSSLFQVAFVGHTLQQGGIVQ